MTNKKKKIRPTLVNPHDQGMRYVIIFTNETLISISAPSAREAVQRMIKSFKDLTGHSHKYMAEIESVHPCH